MPNDESKTSSRVWHAYMISGLDETIKQLLVKKVPLDPAEVDTSLERIGRT